MVSLLTMPLYFRPKKKSAMEILQTPRRRLMKAEIDIRNRLMKAVITIRIRLMKAEIANRNRFMKAEIAIRSSLMKAVGLFVISNYVQYLYNSLKSPVVEGEGHTSN